MNSPPPADKGFSWHSRARRHDSGGAVVADCGNDTVTLLPGVKPAAARNLGKLGLGKPFGAAVAVIGSGITGLVAALHLAEAGRHVAVLDAAEIGAGASSRNAGFVGRTLKHGFGDLLRKHGPARAVAVYREMQDAFDAVGATIAARGSRASTGRTAAWSSPTPPASSRPSSRSTGCAGGTSAPRSRCWKGPTSGARSPRSATSAGCWCPISRPSTRAATTRGWSRRRCGPGCRCTRSRGRRGCAARGRAGGSGAPPALVRSLPARPGRAAARLPARRGLRPGWPSRRGARPLPGHLPRRGRGQVRPPRLQALGSRAGRDAAGAVLSGVRAHGPGRLLRRRGRAHPERHADRPLRPDRHPEGRAGRRHDAGGGVRAGGGVVRAAQRLPAVLGTDALTAACPRLAGRPGETCDEGAPGLVYVRSHGR